MDLKVFDGQEKSELSMIEVAHAILAYHNEAMAFADLTNEIQQYLGKSDEEIRERLSQFYTDLNVDGSFISLGTRTNRSMKQRLVKPKTKKIGQRSAGARSMPSWQELTTTTM